MPLACGGGAEETVFNTVGLADQIEGMVAGWGMLAIGGEAVGAFLTVVGESRFDRERRLVEEPLQEALA